MKKAGMMEMLIRKRSYVETWVCVLESQRQVIQVCFPMT